MRHSSAVVFTTLALAVVLLSKSDAQVIKRGLVTVNNNAALTLIWRGPIAANGFYEYVGYTAGFGPRTCRRCRAVAKGFRYMDIVHGLANTQLNMRSNETTIMKFGTDDLNRGRLDPNRRYKCRLKNGNLFVFRFKDARWRPMRC